MAEIKVNPSTPRKRKQKEATEEVASLVSQAENPVVEPTQEKAEPSRGKRTELPNGMVIVTF